MQDSRARKFQILVLWIIRQVWEWTEVVVLRIALSVSIVLLNEYASF